MSIGPSVLGLNHVRLKKMLMVKKNKKMFVKENVLTMLTGPFRSYCTSLSELF